MSLQSLPLGFVLSDRYEIQKVLGTGGMGAVYLAFDRALSETVAIKVLRQDKEQTPEAARRFLSEIKLARTVTHKNVCRIYEYGTDHGQSYISMAFVDGTDLRRLIGERGALAWEQAFDVAIQVADGLEAIHDEGIVHRDLKSPNIMVDGRGVVRLMDFGIAKHWEEAESSALTVAGAIVGTPEYMSPEQVRGERLDQRSDIYALGVVIYEMFTGRPPFRGETPVATILKHLNDPPPLEGPGAESLPPSIVAVLRRALAKDPADRFASAGDLRAALQEARIAGPGSPSRVTVAAVREPTLSSPPTVVPKPPRRRVAATAARAPRAGASVGVWIAGGMLALTALALATVVVLVLRRPRVADAPLPTAPPGAVSAVASPSVAVTASSDPGAAPRSPTPSASVQTAASSPFTARPSPARPSAGPDPRSAHDPALEGLLAEAESALASQQYDMALEFYEEALKKDPGNARATVGRDLTLQARRRAPADAARGRTFVQGTSRWLAPPSTGPRGFEDSAMASRRVDQGAPVPGAIHFEVTPPAFGAGDDYRLTVSLINESFSPIQVREVHVATSLNGRTAAGPVNPKVRVVPPRQKAVLFEIADRWKADTASWSMVVTVKTERGEAFANEATWK